MRSDGGRLVEGVASINSIDGNWNSSAEDVQLVSQETLTWLGWSVLRVSGHSQFRSGEEHMLRRRCGRDIHMAMSDLQASGSKHVPRPWREQYRRSESSTSPDHALLRMKIGVILPDATRTCRLTYPASIGFSNLSSHTACCTLLACH